MSYLLDKAITKEEMVLLEREANKMILEHLQSSVKNGYSFLAEDDLAQILCKSGVRDHDELEVTVRVSLPFLMISDTLDHIREGEI